MKCEVDYCIYNKNWVCILNEIRIDPLHMCDSFELVTIPETDLQKYKNERLKEIEEFWKKHDGKEQLFSENTDKTTE